MTLVSIKKNKTKGNDKLMQDVLFVMCKHYTRAIYALLMQITYFWDPLACMWNENAAKLHCSAKVYYFRCYAVVLTLGGITSIINRRRSYIPSRERGKMEVVFIHLCVCANGIVKREAKKTLLCLQQFGTIRSFTCCN